MGPLSVLFVNNDEDSFDSVSAAALPALQCDSLTVTVVLFENFFCQTS